MKLVLVPWLHWPHFKCLLNKPHVASGYHTISAPEVLHSHRGEGASKTHSPLPDPAAATRISFLGRNKSLERRAGRRTSGGGEQLLVWSPSNLAGSRREGRLTADLSHKQPGRGGQIQRKEQSS